MADTGDGDLKAHQDTFKGFTAMMTWGTLGCFLIGGFVVFLIAQ
jgi:hypothetical protein